jgi:hypothetical protein
MAITTPKTTTDSQVIEIVGRNLLVTSLIQAGWKLPVQSGTEASTYGGRLAVVIAENEPVLITILWHREDARSAWPRPRKAA